jgi:hypothetical protein
MLLFRSEEHVVTWLAGRPPGTSMSLTEICDLAHAWWGNRLTPDWRPRTRDESQAILDSLGLSGPFWQLP